MAGQPPAAVEGTPCGRIGGIPGTPPVPAQTEAHIVSELLTSPTPRDYAKELDTLIARIPQGRPR